MFKEKANEIYKDGVARRGHFSPDPDSAHLKAYLWWIENSQAGEKPARENFCHYWRVVLIWTPLLWVAIKIIIGIEWLVNKFPERSRNDKKPSFYRRHKATINNIGLGCLLALCGVMILALLVEAVIAFWNNPGKGLLILGVVVLVSILTASLVFVIGRLMERAKERNSKKVDDFLSGKISEDEFFGKRKKRAPGKISKFFKGIGDFCHLIFQVVRVKKWKICPFVEIPDA